MHAYINTLSSINPNPLLWATVAAHRWRGRSGGRPGDQSGRGQSHTGRSSWCRWWSPSAGRTGEGWPPSEGSGVASTWHATSWGPTSAGIFAPEQRTQSYKQLSTWTQSTVQQKQLSTWTRNSPTTAVPMDSKHSPTTAVPMGMAAEHSPTKTVHMDTKHRSTTAVSMDTERSHVTTAAMEIQCLTHE